MSKAVKVQVAMAMEEMKLNGLEQNLWVEKWIAVWFP